MRDHLLDATTLLLNEQNKQHEHRLHQSVMQTKRPIVKQKKKV